MTYQAATESYGNAKFTEDFRSENMYQPEQPTEDSLQRHSTLKKKTSLSRKSSLKHSGTRRSRSDSAASQMSSQEFSSPFYTPIPVQGTPTDTLANRFQVWRQVLKDFVIYFREVQLQQETHSRSILKISQTLNNTSSPEGFMKSGGLMDINALLRNFHKEAYLASENARTAEGEIINHLNRLRGDLGLKIKEIKALAGDFKNTVDKEKEATRKAVVQLTDSLTALESNPHSIVGKNEPYLVRLHVEKQLRRQLSEENYLHKAYKNLESSGRELESIVVAEIQKAFENYIKILQNNGQYITESALRLQQIALQLPRDREWSNFVQHDPAFVGARTSLRSLEDVEYLGFKHPATVEVRSGPLERKSKYLRSYTAGWYVISLTHLHEFKSPDRVNDLVPVMSLYLSECQLGSHTTPEANSHKFVLWGRQVGPMHNRHKWTFRAESHETMLQWYEDIKKLIELSAKERNAYIAAQQQAASAEGSTKQEIGDGLENDEADEIPYSNSSYTVDNAQQPLPLKRPEGGRFPSDIQLQRELAEPQRPYSSGSENLADYTQARHHSRSSSAFSYDETHPYNQALEKERQEVIPVMADIPPELERRLSARHNYEENEQLFKQRSNSFTPKPPSHKPTVSYGVDPVTGQPDPRALSQNVDPPLDWRQLNYNNETRTQNSGVLHKPPPRTPTSSYELDPVTGLPDQGAGLIDNTTQPTTAPVTLSLTAMPQTGPIAQGPPSIITLRDIHVPGEYPKQAETVS